MKRTPLALTLILALLFSAVAGVQFIKLGRGNPDLWLLGFPFDPVNTPPQIIFHSPINNRTFGSNSLWLNFTIIKPDSWFFVADAKYITPNNYVYVNITSLNYTIDGVISENIPFHDVTNLLVEKLPNRTVDFSTNLTLPEGIHTLKLDMQCDSFCRQNYPGYPPRVTLNFSSQTVYFTIASISVLSPQQETYTASNVSLNFYVCVAQFKQLNQTMYSLDGQKNITISGNTTLTGLPNGLHNVTVYANDTFGNMGMSETISFTITEPFPTTLVAVASVVSVVLVGISLLVYFRKRRHIGE